MKTKKMAFKQNILVYVFLIIFKNTLNFSETKKHRYESKKRSVGKTWWVKEER